MTRSVKFRLFIAGLMAMAALAVAGPVQAGAPMQARCTGVHGRLVCNGHSVPRPAPYICLYVTRQQLEFVAWQAIIDGGALSTAGLLADGTVAGVPLGALLGVLGISQGIGGSFLLWYADTYYQPGWHCNYV